MIPIQIQCGCGQLYSFEVEPVGGRMPGTVTCPACGTDGTAAANAWIAQIMQTQASAGVAGGAPLRVASAVHSEHPATLAERRGGAPLPGQTTRTQAKFEAKAKISWGDSPMVVLGYLRSQGFSLEEARLIVEELSQERAAVVRYKGIRNILVGAGLVCVPLVAFLIFMSVGYILVKTFLLTIAIGLGGVWLIIKGIHMVLVPKSEGGDLAEQ